MARFPTCLLHVTAPVGAGSTTALDSLLIQQMTELRRICRTRASGPRTQGQHGSGGTGNGLVMLVGVAPLLNRLVIERTSHLRTLKSVIN